MPRTLALVGPGPDPDGGPARRHHSLWQDSQEVVRCRTSARLVRAAVAWLEQWAGPRPADLVGLRWMAALDHDGRAVLLPTHLRRSLHPLGARLRRIGTRPVDSPLVDLDTPSGLLVVGASALAPGGVLPAAEEAIPSGRFPVDHVVVPAGPDCELRASGTLALLAGSALPGPPPDAILRAVEQVARRALLHRLGSGTADEIIAQLGRSLSG